MYEEIEERLQSQISTITELTSGLDVAQKTACYRGLQNHCEWVNLRSVEEHDVFRAALAKIDINHNAFCSSQYKPSSVGFSTYSVGYHGWLKEIHAIENTPDLETFLSKFIRIIKHVKGLTEFPVAPEE